MNFPIHVNIEKYELMNMKLIVFHPCLRYQLGESPNQNIH